MGSIKLGCDPEGFIIRKDGVFISAAGLFPGNKREPHRIEKGAVQVDGTALEFNIDAAENEDEFAGNIATVVSQIEEMVKKVDKDFSYIFRPIANFSKEDWDAIDADAKVLGCDPDYDYRGEVNPNPADILLNKPVRTAAGHVHIGWTENEMATSPEHFADCMMIASHFYSNNIFQPKVHDEYTRLQYYGGNGSFRPKKYGVELRSPSNLWVRDDTSRREVYRTTRKEFRAITGL